VSRCGDTKADDGALDTAFDRTIGVSLLLLVGGEL